jgi:hypothetical protein
LVDVRKIELAQHQEQVNILTNFGGRSDLYIELVTGNLSAVSGAQYEAYKPILHTLIRCQMAFYWAAHCSYASLEVHTIELKSLLKKSKEAAKRERNLANRN